MKLLNRTDLLQKEKLEVVLVDLGNDEGIYVRQMTGNERDKFEQSLRRTVKDKKGNTAFELALDNFRSKLVVCCACDEAGTLLFKPEDYALLSQSITASKLEKIVNVAQKLNAISEEDKEELVKNLGAGETGNSTLDSVEN